MSESGPGTSPAPILLVEDDEGMAELIQAILEEEGHSLRRVADGQAALDTLAASAPRLVLLDYSLPDMTGLDVVDRVAAMPPFLITTGNGDERVAVESMKRGARDYLVKDEHFMESLPVTVHRILRDLDTQERLALTEARLRESQEQMRIILERTNNVFWDWDLQNGRYTMSDQAYRMLGYEVGEISPDMEAWKAHLHPEDLGPMMKLLQAHLEGPSPAFESEFRLQKKSGGWVWMLSRGQVVSRGPDGRALRISGIMTEITQLKRAEETIRQAEKSGSLSLMAAGIAHDFNNQFQTLLSNLELAQRGVEASSREGRALIRAVEILRNSSQLSQKLLDFTGKSFRRTQRLELESWLPEQDAGFQHLARGFPEAQYLPPVAAGLPAIEADPGQMAQILRNLLHNGFEALQGRQGRVHLQAQRSELGLPELELPGWVERPEPGAYLGMGVEDEGAGMDPGTLARVGDPFFSTKASGRGLGLATTRGILRSHGGGLRIVSELGRGTSIWVYLPLSKEAATPAAVPHERSADPHQKLLLLVDDEEPLREVMAEAIRDVLGYPILEARDGLEALDLFQKRGDEIALVLMDAKMPRMTGTESFQRMKELRPDVKAILCSGYSEEFGQSTAQGFGFQGFLKKPFSLSALEEAIQSALGG